MKQRQTPEQRAKATDAEVGMLNDLGKLNGRANATDFATRMMLHRITLTMSAEPLSAILRLTKPPEVMAKLVKKLDDLRDGILKDLIEVEETLGPPECDCGHEECAEAAVERHKETLEGMRFSLAVNEASRKLTAPVEDSSNVRPFVLPPLASDEDFNKFLN